MSSQSPKRAVFAALAGMAAALGHRHRLELLEHIGQGERSVEDLAALADLTVANASRHLQLLRQAGLVTARRDGKRVLYRHTDGAVVTLLSALRRVGERNLAEIDRIATRYFRLRDSLEPVSRKELLRRMREGSVTVIDVRPAEEFALGHLPGALSMPLRDVRRRLAELPPDREIIAYCRGAYCVFSFEAVALLRAAGRAARRLEEGFPEWKSAGLPVDGSQAQVRRAPA